MALFNYATKEITLKIVYYGPGLSGKTTNLQHLHAVMNPETKGKLLSLSTEADRTLFFDFLPIELGKIRDFSIRFQLYTVPGQVRYNATRKVVLKGADAVVFVADSQMDMREQNLESFENMRENLISNNINPDTIPIILQFNKRDLKNILPIAALNKDLNPNNSHEVLEAVAINGTGVQETFKQITMLLLRDIARKHKIEIQPVEEKKEPQIAEKPAVAQKPQPTEPEKRSEPVRVQLKAHEPESFSGEPVFEPTDFLTEEEELEPGSAYEIEEAEVVEEAEPVEAIAETGTVAGFGRYEPEPTEEISPPVQEPYIAEPARKLPEIPATAGKEQYASRAEIRPFPVEKVDALADSIENLSGNVRDIEDMLRLLQRSLSDINSEIKSMKIDLAMAKQQEPKAPEPKDFKEFKELRREQKETTNLLKDILDLLGAVKEKKSWFRF
jgi:signal recognition particle receptor subunit beta